MPTEKQEEKRWPVVRLSRTPKSDRLRFAPSGPAPGYEKSWDLLTEPYFPASSLLSDEAVEAAARANYDRLFESQGLGPVWDTLSEKAKDFHRRERRADLQALADHLQKGVQ